MGVNRSAISEVGRTSGQIAAWLFIATLLPGIARRFKVQHIVFTFLMFIRRQLGVSMFLLGFLHYASIRLFPILFAGVPPSVHHLYHRVAHIWSCSFARIWRSSGRVRTCCNSWSCISLRFEKKHTRSCLRYILCKVTLECSPSSALCQT